MFFRLKLQAVEAFFFKIIDVTFKILCAISQSTYFAVSYSGRLDRMLDRIKLDDECATYSRKVAVIYTSIAWAMFLVNLLLLMYSVFFVVGSMDILLAPITTHVYLSDLLFPRIVMYLLLLYREAAWIFPHAMSLMLASVFTHEYKVLGRSLDTILADSDGRRLSDSDVETLRQRHQEISMSVKDTDDFLMFHNAGAFCCQLLISILLLYDLIFFRDDISDSIVITIMRVFWMFGITFGLVVTTAGGIMVNHYVSTKTNCLISTVCRPMF